MRLAHYAGLSTAAAAACLLKAFHQRPNFYSATVYLAESNACLLILTNLLLVVASSVMYALQRLLYGPLRPIEIEQLSEKAWYAVLDTLLAMPSFREDVGGWLLAMFSLLLAGKVWGWIGEGRVDVLEQQPPANPRLFHMRLATSLILSVLFDFWMLDYCVETVLADPRPGMMVIFTFEFAVLSIFSIFTLSRYCLSLIQTRIEKQQMDTAIAVRKEEIKAERAAARLNEVAEGESTSADPAPEEPIEVDENEVDVPGWEDKRRYLFALEVITDFVKLMIYIVFFTVSITFNGLPMHIMRDVYMTFASFSKRVGDYVAYRKATSDMNTRYPDATTEEIRGDSCIVCRENMVAWEQPQAEQQPQPADDQPAAAPAPERRRDEGLRAKKLPCGHILHLRCLKAWLERQQVCPTCRRPVVTPQAPAQPGQQGAAGGDPAAPGQQPQQPQQPARRQNRARIFNFGPVRIGFLNGPGDQLGNIVRQMQNPNAAAGQNGAQAANQQGPNHLGLQDPYPPNQAGSTNAYSGSEPRASIPAHIQLRQAEQRLMQDAYDLNLNRQQLQTLHAMEAELTRLRASYLPLQPVGTGDATQIQATSPPILQMPQGNPLQFMPTPFMGPVQSHFGPFAPRAFQGNPEQQFVHGDERMPRGLNIPDGWTMLPLRRLDGGTPLPEINVQSSETQAPQAAGPPPTHIEPSSSGDATAAGPTDGNGSPLFIPTGPSPGGSNGAGSSTAETAAPTSTVDGPSQESSHGDHKTPWNSESWSFIEPPNGHHTNGDGGHVAASSEPSSENGAPKESAGSGKGKGKAVEVEDAPDTED